MSVRAARRKSFELFCCLAIATAAIAAVAFMPRVLRWFSRTSTQSKSSDLVKLQITQISPSSAPFIADKMASVEVAYSVRNVSPITINGLNLQLSCRCQVGKPINTQLVPGETANCSVFFRAPYSGRKKERVAIMAGESHDAIGWLDFETNVLSHPPELVSPIPAIEWTRIEGDRAVNRIQFTTIERLDEIWIKTCKLRVDSQTVSADLERTIRSADDPNIVYCSYDAEIASDRLPRGRYHGQLEFDTDGPPLDPIPFDLRILPPIEAIPELLEFTASDERLRIIIVNRVTASEPVPSFDGSLIDVSRNGSEQTATTTFDVRWQKDAPQNSETEVKFSLADFESISVKVRWRGEHVR